MHLQHSFVREILLKTLQLKSTNNFMTCSSFKLSLNNSEFGMCRFYCFCCCCYWCIYFCLFLPTSVIFLIFHLLLRFSFLALLDFGRSLSISLANAKVAQYISFITSILELISLHYTPDLKETFVLPGNPKKFCLL